MCIREMTERLKADHQALEKPWQCVRRALEKMAAARALPLSWVSAFFR